MRINSPPTDAGSSSTASPHPETYRDRKPNWHCDGRYLRIWSPKDVGLHKKAFILYNSKNDHGSGVLVDEVTTLRDLEDLDRDGSTPDSTIALKCCVTSAGGGGGHGHSHSSQANRPSDHEEYRETQIQSKTHRAILRRLDDKLRHVHLNKHSHSDSVPPGAFIRLEHTFDIPFCKYPCEDLGVLDRDSISEMRFAYIEYLVKDWGFENRVTQHAWQ